MFFQIDRHSNYTLLTELKKQLIKISWIRRTVYFFKVKRTIKQNTHYNPSSKIKFEKTPYIIHRNDPTAGLFSYLTTILGGIAYAEKHNFIPVVDMKNKNPYLYDDEVGKINAWEYYFEQPENISLEEALSSQKYIIGPDTIFHEWPDDKIFHSRKNVLDYWRKICKKYIRFKPEVLERLNALQEKTKGKKILGVLVRGTDYVAGDPKGRTIQQIAEQAVEKVQEVLREKNFDAVYLATEDKNISAKFQETFGEKLILPETVYVDYDYSKKNAIAEYEAKRPNDRYLRGLEYLVSMLFLSKCPSFVTSMTCGSVGAVCLSEGFEYLYVFDLGQYE